jgi:hypothetical protein
MNNNNTKRSRIPQSKTTHSEETLVEDQMTTTSNNGKGKRKTEDKNRFHSTTRSKKIKLQKKDNFIHSSPWSNGSDDAYELEHPSSNPAAAKPGVCTYQDGGRVNLGLLLL